MSPPAVVIGGVIGATSVVRTLGRAGIDVHVLATAMPHSPLRRSRFPASYSRFTDKDRIQEDWLEWLEHNADSVRGAALLPCDDDALELIARNRPRLVELGYRPFEINDEMALAMLDKARIYELAEGLGIGAPVMIRLVDQDDLERVVEEMPFPCALKPQHSHLFGRHYSEKAIAVQDAEELRRLWAPMHELGLEMIATEIVDPSSEECLGYMTYLDESGRPLFHFTKAKVRQYPPRFGTGCYHVTRWYPDIAEEGLRFFQGVGVRGLAYVEFKRAVDGTPKVVDVNHRFLDSTDVVRRSGIDIAQLTYDILVGRPVDPPDTFRENVRMLFVFEDLRGFIELKGDLKASDWLRSLAGVQHFPIFAWDDPLPSVSDVAWIVGRGVRKAGRKLRGSDG